MSQDFKLDLVKRVILQWAGTSSIEEAKKLWIELEEYEGERNTI